MHRYRQSWMRCEKQDLRTRKSLKTWVLIGEMLLLTLHQRLNECRDKLAAAQLDVDRRDGEIEQLNEELDAKVRDHDAEVQQVEVEWRDEVLEARERVDELKDVSHSQ